MRRRGAAVDQLGCAALEHAAELRVHELDLAARVADREALGQRVVHLREDRVDVARARDGLRFAQHPAKRFLEGSGAPLGQIRGFLERHECALYCPQRIGRRMRRACR